MRAPAEGKQREEQADPPPPKKKEGGQERPTATTLPTNTTRGGRTPHPDGTEDRTPRRGTGGLPSQTRQHQAKGSGPPGEGTPKTRGHTPRWEEKKTTNKHPGREEKGWGDGDQETQDRDNQQPTPQSRKKKRNQWREGGANPTNGNTRTPARHRRPPRKSGGRGGTRTTPRTAPKPNQEGRGAAEAQAQHTRPHSTPQPGKAGYKRGAHTNTRRNTPTRSGGARHQPRPNHTPPHRTPNQGVPETTQDRHTSGNTSQHLGKERQGTAETRTPARTPTPHTRAGNGREQEERAHSHARPKALTKTGRMKAETQTQPQTLQTPAGKRGAKPQTVPKHIGDPSQGLRGYRNPNPSTTRTQAQTPHTSRKPSVHSPGTEAACAMQVTRPSQIRRPGVRLHPKACAASGLEAQRATPNASEPEYQEHACMPWEQDTPGCLVNL